MHGLKGGDLYGVVEHLDRIASLGVTALYLNPIFSSASNHRYHTYDYLAVDPLLGGDDALRALLHGAHARGIRIVLDAVFNHASRGFWPFHHVLETGGASPYRDWFLFDQDALDAGTPLRAYASDPLPTEGRGSLETLGYTAWWDLPALPKLNTDNPNVREYLMGVAEHWTRFGIDGWRLDVPAEITTQGFWQEFRQRVRAINPEAYIVGEIWQERADLLDGSTYDGLMNYPLTSAILSFVPGSHLDRRVVEQAPEIARQVEPGDGAAFLARLEGLIAAYAPRFVQSLLCMLDSHDTPRFLTCCAGDRASLRLAWVVLMTLPGAPCIYYGDEVGMVGEMDPGCRAAFPADPRSWDLGLTSTLRALIRLRRETPATRSGEFQPLGTDGMAAAYRRGSGRGSLLIALNAGDAAAALRVDTMDLVEIHIPELGGGPEPSDGVVLLAPRDARVFRTRS